MLPQHPLQHGNKLQHTPCSVRQRLRPRQALHAVRASQTKQSLPSEKPRQTRKTSSAPQPPSFVSQPVTVNVQQPDSNIERAVQPWWSTWCGVSNGVWSGQVAAFSPATGEAEALSLGEDKKPILDLYTLTTEERVADDDTDVVIRRSRRCRNPQQLQIASSGSASRMSRVPASTAAADPADPDACELAIDELPSEQEGFVYFDGGAYSRGPFHLRSDVDQGVAAQSAAEGNGGAVHLGNGSEASPDGDVEPARPAIHAVEQCLTWGGEQRIRLHLTLAVAQDGSQELEVDVLRLLVFTEAWEGLLPAQSSHDEPAAISPEPLQPASQDATPSAQPETSASNGSGEGSPRLRQLVANPLSQQERVSAEALAGQWKVLDLTAVPIEEKDVLTGVVRKVNVFFSQQTEQTWAPPTSASLSEDGAAMWLPHRLMVELRMVPAVSRGNDGDSEEGMQASSSRGLLISTAFLARDGMLISMQREYDAEGSLTEVRSRSAVRGGWVPM